MPILKIHEQQKEWAIKAAAGIATFILCYAVMIHPVFHDVTVLRQDILRSKNRSDLYREIGSLKENLERSETSLATLTERSQILGRISDIAARTQLHIETLTPRTEPDGGYTRLKMDLDGQGTFFSLLKFLQAVEKNKAAIKVRNIFVTWKPSMDLQEDKNSLEMQLVFETLLKPRAKKNNA